ncbi:ATP-binding protein, partial [Salmonella enterica]|nr:ATP-binding protein [Salmonella enterica]
MSIIVGEVIAVSGVRISLRIFEDSNHETIFYGGVKYRGISLREHVSIQRGFIDIVCLVEGEFLDEKRLETDAEKVQYVRNVDVRPIGYIVDDKFFEGVKYMPMIRDKASLLSELMVGKIYGADGKTGFSIGSMLKENVPINLPWMRLFNSHLGIFGNTGSGKSNTLAKLYTTLFNERLQALQHKSQFVIIDFNGEYTEDQLLPAKNKQITVLDSKKAKHKFKIEGAHFWDVETLSLLFQATTNTQQPFLRRVLSGKEKFKTTPLKRYVEKVFEKVFSTGEAKSDALDLSREIARMIDCELL